MDELKYKKVKDVLKTLLLKAISIQEFINSNLFLFWTKLLERQSNGRWSFFFKKMLENEATRLFINTILFFIIGSIFGGLINQILFLIACLNILVFLIKILGWKDKLDK